MSDGVTLSSRLRKLMAQAAAAAAAARNAHDDTAAAAPPPAADPATPYVDLTEKTALPQAPLCPIGIPSLDRYLGGGLPHGTAWLLLGPPFTGKELLARRFLATGVVAREPGLKASTDAPVFQERERLLELLPEGTRGDDVVEFLDLRRNQRDDLPLDLLSRYRGPQWTAEGFCRDVTMRLAPTDGRPRVRRFVWESLSTFQSVVGPEGAGTALMHVSDLLRRHGACGLIVVDPVGHTVPEVQFFKRQVDGVIEVRAERDSLRLRVEGGPLRRPSPWVEFEVAGPAIRVLGYWNGRRIA